MKKVLLIFVVIYSFFTAYGQTEKGKIYLSGGTGFQFASGPVKEVYDGETEGEYNQGTFSLIPSLAYFIMDNLAIGLAGNYTFNSTKDDDDDKSSSSNFMLVPAAIYFFPMDGNIRPLVQLGIGYSGMTQKYVSELYDEEDKFSAGGLALNIGGGFAYFVKENISFNFGVSYTRSVMKDSDDAKSKLKSGMLGANFGIGIFF